MAVAEVCTAPPLQIDEDGRGSFWKVLAAQFPLEGLVCLELSGEGTQVDWAWDQVVTFARGVNAGKSR